MIKELLRKRYIQQYNLISSRNFNFKNINVKEGIDIFLPKLYNIYEDISFNQSKLKFKVGKYSNNLINLFSLIGIGRVELINSTLNTGTFKLLIQEYESFQLEEKEKIISLYKYDKKTISSKNKMNYLKLEQKLILERTTVF